MRLGALFSGGKDSTLAIHIANKKEEVVCLITIVSKNQESYMFHTPNINITSLQAEAMNLPLVSAKTEGKKEEELVDLKHTIAQAKEQFNLDGLITGAVESVYQVSRIQQICNILDLWSFNPLWKHNQQRLLETLVKNNFQVIISGVFAYPLDEKWLGKQIDPQIIQSLLKLQTQYGISPSGEGGEIETTVLDAPLFRKKVKILDSMVSFQGYSGVYSIKKAQLVPK